MIAGKSSAKESLRFIIAIHLVLVGARLHAPGSVVRPHPRCQRVGFTCDRIPTIKKGARPDYGPRSPSSLLRRYRLLLVLR